MSCKGVIKIKTAIYVGIPIIILVGIFYWLGDVYSPTEEALAYLESSNSVNVLENEDWFEFIPEQEKITTGIIFYPGGKVKAESYAPLAFELAEKGYMVSIIKMPLHLAVLAPNKANKYINNNEKINNWVIMGHSLGGAMAATFSENHPEKLETLIMLAAYPANSVDLSDKDIDVLSIYASEDRIADKGKILAAKEQLPESTEFVEIKGGNHSYFGSYGLQKGDGEATITEIEQRNLIINYIVQFLN
jgi:hypothetical protein